MRHVPGWALLAAVCAPLLLVGAWSAAEALQGPGYDPATTTISVLAAYGAPGYWLMTAALLALGACYMTIAAGLRPAARAGRLALAGGGAAAMGLTLVPAPLRGGDLGHGTVATTGFVLLALWPVLAADRSRAPAPWGLRPRVCAGATAAMAAGAVLLLGSLLAGWVPGVTERALTFAQALWPLLVVLSCRRAARAAGEARG
ncbi:DUF998 domain-containing protein [Streptomyces evansiae]|uniref:DUF998 domain-containing protein n=1 Tax=Streptomyces evansiae TaxID=3075535 RepID=UPI0028874E7E|nr:DUF998 domain-containing protein [Streptomyces sp. DSM 41859]MDT0421624.1 DUF998 domain-containing protein [Streptomyces sp. DSM 41859]